LLAINQELRGDKAIHQEKREQLATEEAAILTDLTGQLNHLPDVFEQYLSFKHIY